jgi:hypothetical protein
VLIATLLGRVGAAVQRPEAELMLQGISGQSLYVESASVIESVRDDGGPARVRGMFAALIDATATGLSVVGRDVLNNFDVIVSRRSMGGYLWRAKPGREPGFRRQVEWGIARICE